MRCDPSEYISLIQSAIVYFKDIPNSTFATKKEWEALKNRKPSSLQKQDMSPTKNIETNETPLKSHSQPPLVSPICRSQEINKPSVNELSIEKKPDRPPPSSQNLLNKNRAKIHTNDLSIKTFLHRHSIPLREHVLDDAHAVRMMSAYKEHIGNVDVVIFACNADADTLLLVKNLSKSIDQKLAPVKVLRPDRLEREQRWDLFIAKNPLKLIIATSEFLKLKAAMLHYTYSDDISCGVFDGIPLIILSSCAIYTESPKEKLILWNQICTLLKR